MVTAWRRGNQRVHRRGTRPRDGTTTDAHFAQVKAKLITCMRVTVIGTGYVGTVTGVCLGYRGHHVTCVDTDTEKIERLRAGEIPIYEPNLAELLPLAQARGGVDFSTELDPAVRASDVIFIAVGTPPLPS